MTGTGIPCLLWHDLVADPRTRGVPTREIELREAAGLGWAKAGQALTVLGNIVDNS